MKFENNNNNNFWELLLQWPTNAMQLKRTAANVQIKGLQKGLSGDTVPGRVNWTLDFFTNRSCQICSWSGLSPRIN